MSDAQVEGQRPHLSNDMKNSSPDEGPSSPQRPASIQEQDGHASPAGNESSALSKPIMPLDMEDKNDGDAPVIEESTEARLERLGRQRPEVFGSIWAEIVFVFSISMSQVLTVCNISPHLELITDKM
jgi:hypothetical protein